VPCLAVTPADEDADDPEDNPWPENSSEENANCIDTPEDKPAPFQPIAVI
jgi:hypothetical protein